MNELLQAALKYRGHGYSVIPAKPDKKPYIPWTPYQTQKAEPATIEGWWKEWPEANIGIVTGKISGIVVVDVDSEAGQEALNSYIPDSLIVPSSNTPRGGMHLYFKHPGHAVGNATGILPGVDVRGNGGYVIAPPGRGANGKSYTWLEGLSIFDTSPVEMPDELLNLVRRCKDLSENVKDLSENVTEPKDIKLSFIEGNRNDTMFHIALTLAKGGMLFDSICILLLQIACQCKPPYPENEIPAIAKSALERFLRQERNLAQQFREWVDLTRSYFSLTETFNSLQLLTSKEKTNIYQIAHRLCKEGLIERHPNKNGVFRRVESEYEKLNIKHASTESIPLSWPFCIERYYRALPKNIIIIAGSFDAGKTAFLLNFMQMNMKRHRIYYFSSEMGEVEMRNRLENFDIPLDAWSDTFIGRSSNFADVIQPDDINIIDFLEITKDFFLVAEHIKQIFEKLRTGIALIALQKNPGMELGLGGGRSVEKARLYLSMEKGKIRIIKCKNWANTSFNPNRLELDFKLVKGCKFIESTEWRKGGQYEV